MKGTGGKRPTPEWVGELPNGWKVDRLKDVVPRIVGGGTPASGNPENWSENGVVWVTPTDFSTFSDEPIIADSARKISSNGLNSSSATLVPEGTVIMASRATIGTAKLAGCQLATNQGFISFVCNGSLKAKFLFYLINGVLGPLFANTAAGTTFNEISRGTAKRYDFVFPTLSEQNRIVEYLDSSCAAIDQAIEAKRKQLNTLDALGKSIITPAVLMGLDRSRPLQSTGSSWLQQVPVGWKLVSLKRVSVTQSGLTLGKSHDGDLIERPYLRAANVQDGYLDLDRITTIELPDSLAPRYELRPGDVLMTEGGDLDKLGRGFLWHGQIDGCLHQNHVFAIRTIRRLLMPEFLAYLTASRFGRDYFEATGKRTTNLASTNSTKVGLLPVPLPPISEQQEIVEYLGQRLGELRQIEDAITKQIATLSDYRESLIHECVTGLRRITDSDVAEVEANV